MKTKHVLSVLTILSALLMALSSDAATFTATGSGNWSSTTPDAPWPGGIAPGPTDNVTINSPYNVTNDTTETIDYVTGSGILTMATNSTLNVTGATSGQGMTIGTLNAVAAGNTVNYQGNAYFTEYTTYYNLVWSGLGAPYVTAPLTVLNDFTMSGNTGGQAGPSGVYIGHNWNIGPNTSWDISCADVSVGGNTTIDGRLKIGCGSGNIANFNNVTIDATGSFDLGDTVRATITGNLTNSGAVLGINYAGFNFTGTGQVTGTPFSVPWSAFKGTTTISADITFAHSPDFDSTVVFDLANPGQLDCSDVMYFNNTLTVINSGAPLTTGSTYQLFNAAGYNYPYSVFSTVNLPPLAAGLSWVNTLTTDGSISITGTPVGGTPVISLVNNGGSLTLSWDAATYPGYTVEAQTNNAATGLSNNWFDTGSGSPFTIPVNVTGSSVFFRLIHP